MFCSTRNSHFSLPLSSAVLQGISPDGGLFFPTVIPFFSPKDIADFSQKNYQDIAEKIFSAFAKDELSSQEIQKIIASAYSPKNFSDSRIAPVKKLSDTLFLLELFHGPTGAFKDFALQFLPRIMHTFIEKTDQKNRCILVATSGDTGGAALAGFANVPHTNCIVFFPKNGVSPLQQAQMQSATGNNVLTIEITGDFDTAQGNIKQIFADTKFSHKLESEKNTLLSSANSINIGRLLPQIFYAFAGYVQMVQFGEIASGEEIDICVPTGNFGDIFAAFLAKQMGLPIRNLTCASNTNNTSAEFLRTGIFDVRGRKTQNTFSPAMDILKASNIERLLFFASGGDSEQVSEWQKSLIDNGFFKVDTQTLSLIQSHFSGDFVNDEETAEEIRMIFEECSYISDPHTAVALRTVRRKGNTISRPKTLVFSTAHYGKFGRTVFKALFPEKEIPKTEKEILKKLESLGNTPSLPQYFYDVFSAPKIHTTSCEEGKENMEKEIEKYL